ncbi:hypothetical protein ABZW49_10765 [Nonomuraea wenchangensis]
MTVLYPFGRSRVSPDMDLRERFRANAERYIYVVEFATGVVKVGRASHKEHRVADHARTAEKHGVPVVRSWVSEEHQEYAENETALIAFCTERWPLAGGKEYFANADYDEVVRYASNLPMTRLTEADLDEYERCYAESKGDANQFINAFWAISEAMRQQKASPETDEEGEEEHILLEDVAPYEFVDTVTAASAAKRHAAEALINHDLRNTLDPHADIRHWKQALHTAQHGYEISLLLRALIEHAGVEVADEVARSMWSATYENCGDYRDELVAWATEDGTDLDVLSEMARASYEQIQKLKSYAPPGRVPGQSELPLDGA